MSVVVSAGDQANVGENQSFEMELDGNGNNESDRFAGGSGTEDDPYEIKNWTHLNNVRENLTEHFILESDLDDRTDGYEEYVNESENGWEPIGEYENGFKGCLEGNGYHISELYVNRSENNYVGLFGYTNENALLENISLLNIDIKGDQAVGGLIGWNEEGTVNNSNVTGKINGEIFVGGLIGRNKGTLKGLDIYGDIIGNRDIGGLVGENDGSISDSYASGNVTGDGSEVGGLVGTNSDTIENSYASGKVDGNENVGGLVGASVVGSSVENSFWDKQTTNQDESDGGTGKITDDMQSIETYNDEETEGLEDPWDIDDVLWSDVNESATWNIVDEETYPFLSWEGRKGYELNINSTEGGSVSEPDEGTFDYEKGTVVNLEAVADENHTFVGWTGDNRTIEDKESSETTIEMHDDYNITAEFEIKSYDLSVDVEGKGEVEVEIDDENETFNEAWSDTLDHGTVIVLNATAGEDSLFEGWTGDTDEIEEEESQIEITIYDDMDLTANFIEEANFSVTIDEDKSDEMIYAGEQISITAEIENKGEEEKEQSIVLYEEENEDKILASEYVTLGDGESENVTLSFEPEAYDQEKAENFSFKAVVASDDDRAEIDVTVEVVSNIEIKNQPKLDYIEGQELDLSELEIELIWTDDRSDVLDYEKLAEQDDITTDPEHGTVLGLEDDETTVTVTHDPSSEIAETEELSVGEDYVTSVSVTQEPELEYIEGEGIDLTGLEVKVEWEVSEADTLTWEDDDDVLETDLEDETLLTVDDHDGEPIKIWHESDEDITATTDELTVEDDYVTEIEVIEEPELEYIEGEVLDLSELKIQVEWESALTETLIWEDDEGLLESDPEEGTELTSEYEDESVEITHEPSGETIEVGFLSILEEASFSVLSLEIDPEEPVEGEDIEISIEVENTGDLSGEYTPVLEHNGEEIVKEEYSEDISEGSVESITITYSIEDTGDHELVVGGENVDLTVDEETALPMNYVIAGLGFLLIVVIIAVLISKKGGKNDDSSDLELEIDDDLDLDTEESEETTDDITEEDNSSGKYELDEEEEDEIDLYG